MIAVSFFGIVSIVCFSNYLLAIKNIKIINDKIDALILAQQKIEELKMNNEEIKEGSGNFSDENSDFTWEIKISDNVIYESEENFEIYPYELIIKGPSESYSTILPFLKVSRKNE